MNQLQNMTTINQPPQLSSVFHLSADELNQLRSHLDDRSFAHFQDAITHPTLRWSSPDPNIFASPMSRSVIESMTISLDGPLTQQAICDYTRDRLVLPKCKFWKLVQTTQNMNPLNVLSWGCLDKLIAPNAGSVEHLVLENLIIANLAAGAKQIFPLLHQLRHLELCKVTQQKNVDLWMVLPRGLQTIKLVRDLSWEMGVKRSQPGPQEYKTVTLPQESHLQELRELHLVLQECIHFQDLFSPTSTHMNVVIPLLKVTFTRHDEWPVGL